MAINLNGTTGITTTGLTSNGIDDNATSTAMTLDSSGNLFVTKTSSDTNAVGVELGATGYGAFCRDANKVAIFNRKTNDGTILDIKKDGSTVGTIGSVGGVASYFSSSQAGGIKFTYSNSTDAVLAPCTTTGATKDASHDIGSASGRFRNLYLSGGVYLGGVGAANKLDDYEEGTWTPNVGGTATYSQQSGQYIKIGTLVYVFGKMTITGIGTGSTNHFSGLPFAAAGEATINISKLDNATFNNYYANLRTSGSSLYLCGQDGLDGTWTVNPNFLTTSTFVQFSGTYHTTA